MSLRIRRGTDAQRSGIVFDQGEIIWTTNTEKLYVGDGVTLGGKNIAAQLAGTGLQWNTEDEVFELSSTVFNTNQIAEGNNNLYFTTERAQDAAASLFTTGTHSGITFQYDDVLNKMNVTVTGSGVDEQIQDVVGAMFASPSNYGISFNYYDPGGEIVAVLSNEVVQDVAAGLFVFGAHTNISFTYNDSTATIDAVVSTEAIQDIASSMLLAGSHTGISMLYNDSLASVDMNLRDEYLQDITGDMFKFGNHTGLTAYYDDGNAVVNLVVDAPDIVGDVSPQLGGDLDLNNFDITGFGNIDYFGTFFNGNTSLDGAALTSNTGAFDIGSNLLPTKVTITTNNSNFATFNTKTTGNGLSFMFLNSYKTSLTSPGSFAGGDLTTAIAARGYNPLLDEFQQVYTLAGKYDSDADFTKALPKSSLILATGSNTNNVQSLGNQYVFDGNGTFSAPSMKTGLYANTIDRDSRLPYAQPGTIIFLASDGAASSITGDSAISSGAVFNVTLSENAYVPSLTSPGTDYAVGEIIKISGNDLDGLTPANDLEITVTAITGGGDTGPVSTFTASGTGIDLTDSYTNVTRTSQTGTGANATMNITVNSDNTYSVYVANNGTGYAVGDTLTYAGTLFTGTSPGNNLVVTVATISNGGPTGPIATVTFVGDAPTLSRSFTSLSQISTSGTTLIMTTDAAAPLVGTVISGTGIETGTTIASVDPGVSVTLDTPTTLNVASETFTAVSSGVPRFQGCTVVGSGTYGAPGYIAPTWASLN